MSTFVSGVLSGFVTLFVIAVLVGSLNWLTRRRGAKKFLHADNRGVILYASRINVRAGGSSGHDGLARSFNGPTVAETELSSIILIEEFLQSLRPTSALLGNTLSQFRIQWRDTSLSVRLSPQTESGIDSSSTIVTLGSPAYNVVSAVTEKDFPNLARFNEHFNAIGIDGVGTTSDVEAFLVERAVNQNLRRCSFYVAGQSELGTATAAGYLLSHWKELHKRYSANQSFALVFAGKFATGGVPELLFKTPA